MSLAAVLFLLQVTSTNSFAEPLSTKHIPRFQMIAAGLYRGGQPGRDGFEFLKNNGIKTVINLRSENDEEVIVKKLGMNYVHIPMSIAPWSKIPEAAIDQYFKVLSDPANYPIFFHCRRGADRTGAMAGFYRVAAQGWEPAKAVKEAQQVGMRWWFPRVKQQIFTFKRKRLATPQTKEA